SAGRSPSRSGRPSPAPRWTCRRPAGRSTSATGSTTSPPRRNGYAGYATAGTTPLLNRGPAGTFIELCDLHSDRPSLRDLFPPGSEFAGEPLPGSAH
ncbi:MAG TPA: hypothetical protein VGI96_04205, partial [Streptosporangiaceae bacterium]